MDKDTPFMMLVALLGYAEGGAARGGPPGRAEP